MPSTPCNAPPGWFCSPLYNRPTICPENWYCLGGDAPARKCMEGSWSAVASIYPEDCVDHMNVQYAVFFMLFFIFLAVGICIWYASWDWRAMKDGTYPAYTVYPDCHIPATQYGTTGQAKYVVYRSISKI